MRGESDDYKNTTFSIASQTMKLHFFLALVGQFSEIATNCTRTVAVFLFQPFFFALFPKITELSLQDEKKTRIKFVATKFNSFVDVVRFVTFSFFLFFGRPTINMYSNCQMRLVLLHDDVRWIRKS